MSRLLNLSLTYFRNHLHSQFHFETLNTVIIAPNAEGKTSVLEAIQLLATGESFRADKVEEMVTFDQELGRIKGTVELQRSDQTNLDSEDQERVELEVIATRGMVQGKKTQARLYAVNTVRRRKKDFIGHFFTVSFRPEDMRLMEGSPGRRRTFMDTPLGLLKPSYSESLSIYDQALKRRNKLLQSVREGEMPASVLTYWNLQLIKHGELIQKQRRDFLDFFSGVDFPLAFSIEYQPSVMSAERIQEYLDREIAAGHTLIGPHKDDFMVLLKTQLSSMPMDISLYGSRGQQRMAVLWLKIAEQRFLEEKGGKLPVLLLDDILSELDEQAQDRVLSLFGKNQVILTTTDENVVARIKTIVSQLTVLKLDTEMRK
ncbi:MAG TPA: AAA family ATPase [Vitreimonas sp.]|nr:AAA family ATPase [Vitreimonas sp.]